MKIIYDIAQKAQISEVDDFIIFFAELIAEECCDIAEAAQDLRRQMEDLQNQYEEFTGWKYLKETA